VAKKTKTVTLPIFYEHPGGFVAVFSLTEAFEIKYHGFGKSEGYEFNMYRGKQKIMDLCNHRSQLLTPEEFYLRAFQFMKRWLNRVKTSTVRALPEAVITKRLLQRNDFTERLTLDSKPDPGIRLTYGELQTSSSEFPTQKENKAAALHKMEVLVGHPIKLKAVHLETYRVTA
jgi:hypothetical protein